jgi:hypothetical protein
MLENKTNESEGKKTDGLSGWRYKCLKKYKKLAK